MKSDLHIHTLYSDGVFSPEKIVDTAIDVGLQVIALTDHDNVLSYPVAKDYLKKTGRENKLEIIQGIEVNTLYKNYEVHILGYFMNVNDNDFQNMLKAQQQARVEQTNKIIDLLAKKEGIRIKFDDIKNKLRKGEVLDVRILRKRLQMQVEHQVLLRLMQNIFTTILLFMFREKLLPRKMLLKSYTMQAEFLLLHILTI